MQGIIELILATDMARHGEFMDRYKQCLSSGFDVKNEEHLKTVILYQSDFSRCVILVSSETNILMISYNYYTLVMMCFVLLSVVFYSSHALTEQRLTNTLS